MFIYNKIFLKIFKMKDFQIAYLKISWNNCWNNWNILKFMKYIIIYTHIDNDDFCDLFYHRKLYLNKFLVYFFYNI